MADRPHVIWAALPHWPCPAVPAHCASCPAAPLASLYSVWTCQAASYPRAFKFVVSSARSVRYSVYTLLLDAYCVPRARAVVIWRVDGNPFPPHTRSFARLSWCPNPSRFLGLRSCHHREAFFPCPPLFKVGLPALPCSVNTAPVYFLPDILIINL